jgi:hypothetical protein
MGLALEFALCANSENKNAEAFLFRFYPLRCSKMASMPFLRCKFFASQKTYEIIAAGLHAGPRSAVLVLRADPFFRHA